MIIRTARYILGFSLLMYLLTIFTVSCKDCSRTMYFNKDYLSKGQKVTIKINDEMMYEGTVYKNIVPDPAFKKQQFFNDICTDDLKDKIVKLWFKVDELDTTLYLNSEKISGVYLGRDYQYPKLNVLVDSIKGGLYWGNKKVGFD